MKETSAGRWVPALRVLLGIVVSGVALYAVLRQVQWGHLVQAWKSADAELLVLGALIYPSRLLVVAVRWGELLRLYGSSPAFAVRLRATSVGYLLNNLLPLRSGDLVRGGMAVRARVTLKAAASSLLLEKAVDLWALVGIALLAGGAFLRAEPMLLQSLRWVGLAAGLSLLGFLVAALLGQREAADRWCERAVSRPARLAARLGRLVVESGQLCRRPRALGVTMLTTGVNWTIEACFYWLVARALGIQLTGAGAFFMVSVIGLGLTVPTTAGGIGLNQYLAVLVLRVQGVDVNLAAAYSLLSYAVAFLCINGVGIGFVLSGALRPGEPGDPGRATSAMRED